MEPVSIPHNGVQGSNGRSRIEDGQTRHFKSRAGEFHEEKNG